MYLFALDFKASKCLDFREFSQVARPKEQTERRKDLVQAAMDAIAVRGLSGLRLKDIAKEAGLSIGSVSYYYPEIEDLLVEAHREALERFYWNRVEHVDQCESAAEQIVVAIQEGIPDEPVTSDVRTLYELHTYAGRNPAHASMMTTLWDREVSLYERVIERGVGQGHFKPTHDLRVIAETAVALEDAFNLHLVSSNGAVTAKLARERLSSYLATALSCMIATQ